MGTLGDPVLDPGFDHSFGHSVEPSTPEGDLAVVDTHLRGDSIAVSDGLNNLDPPSLRVGAVHGQEVATVELFTGLRVLDVHFWGQEPGRPSGLIAGWVNIELMKNVAEMCQLRRMTPFFADH